jgi:signal transduction histidine kinase/ActR/RegA family two-component response regulator
MHGANFYIDMWDSLARTGTWNGEIWNRRKNGEIYPEHLTITAVKDKQDCITNYVGALTDSTQRQQTMEQLRLTASQLTIANEQIEEERSRLAERVLERTAELLLANQAKNSFLATMSHEIRTPLAGLMGMMELLDLSRLDDKQRELLHAARNSSSGLLRIVNDILDWSKIEAGKLELSPQANRIRDTLQGALETYTKLAVDKDIQVSLEIDSRLADSHHFDSLRVSQIINNYLSNAIKFTARGRVQVRAEWLEHLNGCDTVRFSVQDSGVGVSPEQQSHLFQQYEQGSADTARMYGGTGLGLSICRKLAEMMGGFLTVASVPERGSTFSFTVDLPVSEHSSADVTSPGSGDSSYIGPLVGAGPVVTVLVADDHPINLMLLKQQLDVLGLRADTAPDGEVAFTLWQNSRYDLVITDCHMPKMDGYQLARNIREMELQSGKKRMPIIGWTANVLSEEFENCIAAGMDDLVTKPTELSDMRAMLAKWLEQSGVPETGLK